MARQYSREQLRAMQVENGRRSCRTRWGEAEKTTAVRVFAEDADFMRRLHPRPAWLVRELLRATFGTLWHFDERGRAVLGRVRNDAGDGAVVGAEGVVAQDADCGPQRAREGASGGTEAQT